MTEETWHQARLIPTSGISGAEEQERRATSALLAVMSSVREFGRVLTKPLGAPAGGIQTFIEVPFTLGDHRLFPDGLIRVQRGKKTWTALVEVKTGRNQLATQQLENYLDIAKEQGFNAVITISNEIPSVPGQHPTKVNRRKLAKVDLHHWSWSLVLSEAVLQKEHRGVADPDQAWILGELIRYLEHPRSGALEFEDMGDTWVSVRNAVRTGTLRSTDKTAPQVASRFDGLLRFASLQLGRQLGEEVTPAMTRAEIADPSLRLQNLMNLLADDGILTGAIRIPNTIAPLNVTADLRASLITCHVDIDAPRTGRGTARVNWLIRQLKSARDDVRIEAFAARTRGPGATELLAQVRTNPALIVPDPTKELRSFRVARSTPMGLKRGVGRGAFIDSVIDAVNEFYSETLQHLKAWTATAPKLRQLDPQEIEAPAVASTALSSQDSPVTSDSPRTPTEEESHHATLTPSPPPQPSAEVDHSEPAHHREQGS